MKRKKNFRGATGAIKIYLRLVLQALCQEKKKETENELRIFGYFSSRGETKANLIRSCVVSQNLSSCQSENDETLKSSGKKERKNGIMINYINNEKECNAIHNAFIVSYEKAKKTRLR
jgi:hypothetical protein